jgi:hypothetical protein
MPMMGMIDGGAPALWATVWATSDKARSGRAALGGPASPGAWPSVSWRGARPFVGSPGALYGLQRHAARPVAPCALPARRWRIRRRVGDDAMTVRAVAVARCGFDARRAAHHMSGRQKAVTGVKDAVTASRSRKTVSIRRTGPMVHPIG